MHRRTQLLLGLHDRTSLHAADDHSFQLVGKSARCHPIHKALWQILFGLFMWEIEVVVDEFTLWCDGGMVKRWDNRESSRWWKWRGKKCHRPWMTKPHEPCWCCTRAGCSTPFSKSVLHWFVPSPIMNGTHLFPSCPFYRIRQLFLCLGTRKIFKVITWRRLGNSSFYTVFERGILMMQHWPWALSPETPPALWSGEAAQHIQEKSSNSPPSIQFQPCLLSARYGADLST